MDGFHLAGLYYNPDVRDSERKFSRTQWFGNSDAPKKVWDAVKRLEEGTAGPEDEKMVQVFRNCHYMEFFKDDPSFKAFRLTAARAMPEPLLLPGHYLNKETNS